MNLLNKLEVIFPENFFSEVIFNKSNLFYKLYIKRRIYHLIYNINIL